MKKAFKRVLIKLKKESSKNGIMGVHPVIEKMEWNKYYKKFKRKKYEK